MDWFDGVLVLMAVGVALTGFSLIRFMGSDVAARKFWPTVPFAGGGGYPPALRLVNICVTVVVSALLLAAPFFRVR